MATTTNNGKTTRSFSLEPNLLKYLADRAAAENRSASNLLETILQSSMDEYYKQIVKQTEGRGGKNKT